VIYKSYTTPYLSQENIHTIDFIIVLKKQIQRE